MPDALIAVHYQNDICHPDGRVPFALVQNSPEAQAFFAASRGALAEARSSGRIIVHVHIGFAEDYSDMPPNALLFRRIREFGAVKRGTWGAAAYAGFEPTHSEVLINHTCNSAFRRTDLEAVLARAGVRRVTIMGLATQFAVEHTARDAADIGYEVTVLADCCTSADAEAHSASFKVLAMLAHVVRLPTSVPCEG